MRICLVLQVAAVILLLAVPPSSAVATVQTPTIDLPKKRTAVLLGAGLEKEEKAKASYGKYLKFLESFLEVEYLSGSKKLALKVHEEFQYDNVIIFGNLGAKTGADFIDFIDAGGNVMIIASEGKTPEECLTDELRTVAVDCGSEFTMTPVRDNFVGKVVAKRFIHSKPITGDGALNPITFSGIGLRVESDNPLAMHILSAPSTAYVADPETLGQVYGANIALVSGMQTRIGSRAVFSGSLELFADMHWSAHELFCTRVTRWFTQQHGILRYRDIDSVKLVDGKEVQDGETFRIRDHIRFSIYIEEFNGEKGEWVPFVPPADDPVQVEYTMLDPYVRSDLKQIGTKHTTDLQAPDQYGIFKFVVDYRRTGYNPLVVHHQRPLRPLKLNEYERFIVAAYPYYLSTFSAMFGFILIGFIFLYTKE